MERRFRLTQSSDFMRVRRCGKTYAHPLVVLIVQPGEPGVQDTNVQARVRVGISASRSVGNAVQRNRAKRRLRACMMEFLPQIRPGFDLVVLARKSIEQAGFVELCTTVRRLLVRAGLLEPTIDGK